MLRSECSIWGFSETWLEERETYLYKLDNYNAFYSCRSGRKGGGVALFIKNSFKSRLIDQSDSNQIINWLCVGVGENNLKVSVVYRPPSYSITDFFVDIENILTKHPARHIIMGDFNINLLDNNNAVTNYKNLLQINNFKIINTILEEHATRVTDYTKTIIDHVLLDFGSSGLVGTLDVKPSLLSDHNLILFYIVDKVKLYIPEIRREIKFVDFKKFKLLFKENIDSIGGVVTSFQELIGLIKTTKNKSQYFKTINTRENLDRQRSS